MAIRVAVHRTCDRCAHPFDESSIEYGKPLPQFPKRVLVATLTNGGDTEGTTAGTSTIFRFEDLCPDCDRIVEGYIKKIRLDSEDESPKRKKNKTEAKEEKPVEPKAPEVGGAAAESKITELPGTTEAPAEIHKFEKPAEEEAKASTENPHPF